MTVHCNEAVNLEVWKLQPKNSSSGSELILRIWRCVLSSPGVLWAGDSDSKGHLYTRGDALATKRLESFKLKIELMGHRSLSRHGFSYPVGIGWSSNFRTFRIFKMLDSGLSLGSPAPLSAGLRHVVVSTLYTPGHGCVLASDWGQDLNV